MKKLIVAMAAISMGLMASAASISWSFANVVDSDGNKLTAVPEAVQLALCVDNGDGTWSAVETSTFTVMADYGISTVAGKYTAANTVMAGNTYRLFMQDTSTGELSTPTLLGGTEFTTALSVADDIPSNWKDTTTLASTGTLQLAAVPEPTSGLLLLLGVAGLALRRRRA